MKRWVFCKTQLELQRYVAWGESCRLKAEICQEDLAEVRSCLSNMTDRHLVSFVQCWETHIFSVVWILYNLIWAFFGGWGLFNTSNEISRSECADKRFFAYGRNSSYSLTFNFITVLWLRHCDGAHEILILFVSLERFSVAQVKFILISWTIINVCFHLFHNLLRDKGIHFSNAQAILSWEHK